MFCIQTFSQIASNAISYTKANGNKEETIIDTANRIMTRNRLRKFVILLG
jgi:hypothetical protein